jgi:predicted MPP superfamily phosphohydrolase
MRSPEVTPEEQAALAELEPRVGHLHLRQRLGLERDHEAQIFRRSTHFFHIENWYSVHGLVRGAFKLAGLHARGRRNALAIQVRRHEVALPNLPAAFDGFTILHLSDLHIDMSSAFVDALTECVRPLEYDLCVLTGDYRTRTFGSFTAALAGLERLRPHIKGIPHAVLGNHDTIRLVPGMEAIGYRLLLNEWTMLSRGGDAIYLSGIDDAHYYRMENFHRAAHDLPRGAVTILLSHTPEVYRQAAHADYSLMLCGHTHGGQICLPGGLPILTDADSPRCFARGAWRYQGMIGYTSVGAGTSIVDIRLNCPPEITLHRLRRIEGEAPSAVHPPR